ncbi:hypothetical protein [Nocardioides sp. InS609-2]|nr:hypothetical protein [Nocardioides sp. InS609-2]MBA3781215.1 hypothetical protein [Nocardioides sp.]
MSNTWAGTTDARSPRVRDQARAVVALMTFSALASGALAIGLLLLTTLGR